MLQQTKSVFHLAIKQKHVKPNLSPPFCSCCFSVCPKKSPKKINVHFTKATADTHSSPCVSENLCCVNMPLSVRFMFPFARYIYLSLSLGLPSEKSWLNVAQWSMPTVAPHGPTMLYFPPDLHDKSKVRKVTWGKWWVVSLHYRHTSTIIIIIMIIIIIILQGKRLKNRFTKCFYINIT